MTLTTIASPTVLYGRPAYEGANIRTWIGFKHFMYLVEQAVLQWLRDQGTSARTLYLEHGLGVEIVDCSIQLPVNRGGAEVTVLRGKVTLALVRERTAPAHRPAPDALAGFEVADLAEASTVARADRLRLPDRLRLADGESVESVFGNDPRTFVWSWRAPYFYCHFSDRVQHSGFVRALEEVVDRFLADRGISVGRLLAERSWIPVVSRARVQLVEAAHMEETIHTVFTVVDILRGVMFDARMSCYVQRGAELVPVATAQILHGYAIAAGDGAGGLAELDGEVSRALTGGRP